MTKGFDDLIEFLLEETALRAEQGATTSDYKELLKKFYAKPEQNERSSDRFSNSAVTPQPRVDRRLQEKVWTWLTAHPDITLGKNPSAEIPSLGELEKRESEQHPSAKAADAESPEAAALKLFVTEERMWQAIAGHGPDLRKVPRHEFIILSIVAAHGAKGVIQPEVTRISGQDKRSVPKRTDNLQKNGYIVKTAVLAKGTRTSLCTLKRYAQQTSKKETGPVANSLSTPDEIAKALFVNGLLLYDRFFDILTELLQDVIIIRIEDLKSRLGIRIKTWEMKALWRSTRRLEGLGLIKRVKAQFKRTSQKWFRCIKLLRKPTARDRAVFVTMGIKDADKLSEGDKLGTGVDAMDEDAEGELDPDADQDLGTFGQALLEEENEVEEIQRMPPQWDPDRPTPNFLFDIIAAHGPNGATTAKIRDQGLGTFYRRPVDSILGRLSDIWHISQPPHLRHWAIIRDTGISEKYIHYIYRTYGNFARAVERGEARWEVVITQPVNPNTGRSKPRAKEKANKDKIQHGFGELDEWGFPSIHPSNFQGKNGTATLADCNKATTDGLKLLPHRGHKPKFLANPAMAIYSREDTAESSPGPELNAEDATEENLDDLTQKPRKKYTPRGDKPIGRPRKYALGEEPYNSGNLNGYRKIRALRTKAEQMARRELIKEAQESGTVARVDSTPMADTTMTGVEPIVSNLVQGPSTPAQPSSSRVRLETETPIADDSATPIVESIEESLETPDTAKGKGKSQGKKPKQSASGKQASESDKQIAERLGIDEELIYERAAQILERLREQEEERVSVDVSKPGVYLNPPGSEKPRDPLHKGRPKKAAVLVIKLRKLKGVNIELGELAALVEIIRAAKEAEQAAADRAEDEEMSMKMLEAFGMHIQPGQMAGKRLPGQALPVPEGNIDVREEPTIRAMSQTEEQRLNASETQTLADQSQDGLPNANNAEVTPTTAPKKRGRPRKDPNAPPRPRKAAKKKVEDTPATTILEFVGETPEASPMAPAVPQDATGTPNANETDAAMETPTRKRRGGRPPKDPNAPPRKRKSTLTVSEVPPEDQPGTLQDSNSASTSGSQLPVTSAETAVDASTSGASVPARVEEGAQAEVVPATPVDGNVVANSSQTIAPQPSSSLATMVVSQETPVSPASGPPQQRFTEPEAEQASASEKRSPPKHGPINLWHPPQQQSGPFANPYGLGLQRTSTVTETPTSKPLATPDKQLPPRLGSSRKTATRASNASKKQTAATDSQSSLRQTTLNFGAPVQQRSQGPTTATGQQQQLEGVYCSPYAAAASGSGSYISPYSPTTSTPVPKPSKVQRPVGSSYTRPYTTRAADNSAIKPSSATLPSSAPLVGGSKQSASLEAREALSTAAAVSASRESPISSDADDTIIVASKSNVPSSFTQTKDRMDIDESSAHEAGNLTETGLRKDIAADVGGMEESNETQRQDIGAASSAGEETAAARAEVENATQPPNSEVREESQALEVSQIQEAFHTEETSQAQEITQASQEGTQIPVEQEADVMTPGEPSTPTVSHIDKGKQPAEGVFPDPSLFSTLPKRKKGKWQGGKKQGVKLTSGGILNYNRTKLLVSIIQQCDGVFPGDFEIQRPFIALWQKDHGEDRLVDRDTIKRTIKNAIDSGKLRRLTYTFKNKSGVMMSRHILTTPDKASNDPLVLETQRKVIVAWPRQYTPEQMRKYEHEIGNSWYGGLYEKETELEVKKQSLPAWMEELNARAAEAQKRQEEERRVKAQREGRGLQPLPSRRGDGVRRGRGGRPRLSRLPQEPTADPEFGPWTAFQSNFYVPEGERRDSMPEAESEHTFEASTGSFSLNEFVIDTTATEAPEEAISTDDEDDDSSVYSLSLPGSPRTSRARSPSVASATALESPTRQRWRSSLPYVQTQRTILQTRRPSFQIKLTTAATYDKEWEWQWATSLTNPATRFFPSNGTFSTDYSSYRNARLSLWIEGRSQHRQEFEESMPYSLQEILAASKMKGKERDHNRRGNPNFSRFERDTIKVKYWEDTHLSKKEDIGLVLRQPHFINYVFYGEHAIPADTSSSLQWENELSEYFTLPNPPPFDGIDDSEDELPKKKRRRGSIVEVNTVPRRGRRKTTVNTPETRIVPIRRSALQNMTRQPTADPLCEISSADTKKLLYAMVVVQTLIGGTDNYTNWDVVRRIFRTHEHWDLTSFRNRWVWLKTHSADIIEQLFEEFQDAYLLAYECGDVPSLNYDDPDSYDWEGIVAWAQENLVIKPPVRPIDTVTLPKTRQALEKEYFIEEATDFAAVPKEILFMEGTLATKRRELTERYAFNVPLTPPPSPQRENVTLERAKTWVRATIVAPDDQYNSVTAKEKINTLSKRTLDRAVEELTATRFFRDDHKGRMRPGRAYAVDKSLLRVFERQLTVAQLLEAVKFKNKLDLEFRSGTTSVPLLPTAHDGHVLATINLANYGYVRLEPRLPPVNHNLGDPWPRITKWGFTEGHYKTVNMARDNLMWGIDIVLTDKYVYGNPLLRVPPAGEQKQTSNSNKAGQPPTRFPPLPLSPKDSPHSGFIPLWYDIHLQPLRDWWLRVATAILHVVFGRPGIDARGIRRALKDVLGLWEVDLAVGWMREVGVLGSVGLGLGLGEGEGVGGGEGSRGLRVGEWWWVVFWE